ncbi:hypothetical protein BJ970_004163 [Saccharopolyspora phatthalungensis]|uniref:Uncharacterized protein n=1 Tax=Saccharopolyspora phatthalungensis TaxID=664693 RepID=A0A840QDJ1_9PSEU|nr:hypothetical protein [Saccharopolyspora phatthalungensis]
MIDAGMQGQTRRLLRKARAGRLSRIVRVRTVIARVRSAVVYLSAHVETTEGDLMNGQFAAFPCGVKDGDFNDLIG